MAQYHKKVIITVVTWFRSGGLQATSGPPPRPCRRTPHTIITPYPHRVNRSDTLPLICPHGENGELEVDTPSQRCYTVESTQSVHDWVLWGGVSLT